MSEKGKEKTGRRVFSAREKCQAVLSVWTEKRKPSEVCKEQGINSAMLSGWQDRALEGMLAVLEPRQRGEEERGPALGRKLERLLDRKVLQREEKLGKLQQRLAKIQEEKDKGSKK